MDKNTLQPVAWRVFRSATEYELFTSEYNASQRAKQLGSAAAQPLYTAPPVPRDVLMAAMRDAVSDMKAGAFLADCGTDIAFRAVDYASIADRYASQVQPEPEPVNQQTLAALKLAKNSLVAFKLMPGQSNAWEEHDEANLVAINAAIAAAEASGQVVQQYDHIVDAAKMVHAVPDGWRFCSADFSLQAAGKSKTGSVLLVRDPDGCAEWHKLSDDIKEIVPLYLSGKGNTVDEAIADAVSHRVFLSAAQKPEGGE